MRLIIVAFAAILFCVGPALAQGQEPGAATTDSSTPAQAGATTAQPPDGVPVVIAPTPSATNPVMTGPRLLISTSMGDITLQLDAVRAPKSVANVLRYVREKHYDGTVVYRVVKGFVIQAGSFAAHNKGRPVHKGIPLEADNGLSNLRGAVALGRGDPDSATADFFINLADNVSLDHDKADTGNTTGFAVFGEVTDGMDVVDRIAVVPVGDDGPMKGQAPIDPILVKKVTILK